MATVALAGTSGDPATDTTAGTGAETLSYTIPSDADAVVAVYTGFDNAGSSAQLLDQLNWDDGGSLDFTNVVNQRFDVTYANTQLSGYIMTADDVNWPGTGAQTLYWSAAQNPDTGGRLIVFSLKNVDGSSPTGNTAGKDAGTGTGITLSDNNTADRMGVVFGMAYSGSMVGALNTDGQTVVDEYAAFNSEGFAVAVKNNDTVLSTTSSSHALAGFTVLPSTGEVLAANAGSYTLTGSVANLEHGRLVSAEAGSFTLAGADANLEYGRVLSAEAGSFILTGADANLEHGRVISAEAGAFVLTGADATLTYDSGADPVLTAESTSYTVVGADVTLTYNSLSIDDTNLMDAIRRSVTGDNIQDGLALWFSKTSSETIQDAELRWLGEQGFSSGTIEDRWMAYLNSLGYSGTLNDRLLQYWDDQS